MRPHRLRVTAFGAFAGTEEVRFSELDGLFLLHGETGAGKTTLLDAIAFALYGRVPGERGKARRLRSDHAAPAARTEVELEMTIGGRRLRVTRSPEWERLKKNGTGTTRTPATVRLDEATASAGWENKSTRAGEADAEIAHLMGMSAEQFFQVVLLPQGQFARFLQSDAKDRADLLQRLFGTDRFRAVERWLADQRVSTTRAVEAATSEVGQLMARIAQVAAVPVPEVLAPDAVAPGRAGSEALIPGALVPGAVAGAVAPEVPVSGAPVPGGAAFGFPGSDPVASGVPGSDPVASGVLGSDPVASAVPGSDPRAPGVPAEAPGAGARWPGSWAAGLLAAARAQREAAAGLAMACGQQLDVAQAALGAAEQLAGQQRRRAEALRRQQALSAAGPGVEESRAELSAADRADRVAPVLDEAERAAKAAAGADKGAIQALAAIPAEAAPDEASAKVLEAAARDQEARAGLLAALRPVASQATTEETAAAVARARASDLAATLADLTCESERTRTTRPAIEDSRDAASQAAADLPAATARADSRRRVAADLAALVSGRAVRDRVAEEHRLAAARALTLARDYEQIRKARIEGMSGELARNLIDGSPCPVCGSAEHPEPSEMPATWVSPDEEKQADQRAKTAAGTAEQASQQVAAADAVIADLRARLAEAAASVPDDLVILTATASEASADARRLEAEAAQLATQAAGLGELQRRLEDLDAVIAAAGKRQAELTEQRSAALAEAEGAEQRAAVHREALRAQLGEEGDLDVAVETARRLADVLTAAADALAAATRATEAAAEARQRAIAAATAAGFGQPPAAREDGQHTALTQGTAPAEHTGLAHDTGLAQDTALAEHTGLAHDTGLAQDTALAEHTGLAQDSATGAARAALRDGAWRLQADAAIRAHAAEAEAVATLLADPELDVPLEPAAPVADRAAVVAAAVEQRDKAMEARTQANSAAEQLADLQAQLDGALARLAPLIARAAEVRHLADLAAGLGANQYKMTLSSFVLAARLEEVAAAASQRLLTMTAGRYSLVHTDARKGNARAGLGLLACDSWTGQDRDTATLSGGETFLASLALALGLADVVTAEAAGAPMEALFVDEGFGTLDEDTLDEVMTVLDGLREGGRLVGIVSHVSELRQRIPSRVHVRKGHHGSHVSVTGV